MQSQLSRNVPNPPTSFLSQRGLIEGFEDIFLERLEHRPRWCRNVRNTLPCACIVSFRTLFFIMTWTL